MFKKFFKKGVLLVLSAFASFQIMADEGMWLPMHIKRLNHVDMQKTGLKLTAEEIYSVNNSSLKDAVVSFGGFCTGEIISDEGLLLTNHHCGYGAIQQHSSVKNDYLTDGFWAMKKQDELPTPGLFVKFLVRMDDVTDQVLSRVNESMTELQRGDTLKKVYEEIKKQATQGNHYEADVKSFFDGNEHYLFVYEIFNDVRLVGTPPSSIGKFGGDTDNWMWPRHTADFSMFRVYMAPDGKPAVYSKDNVPLKPKHFLPISIKGIQEADFAMIMGYPGRTNRYLTSYGVKQSIDKELPSRVKIREKKLSILKVDMDASDEVRIKYASKYASISNYHKKWQGEIKGLKALSVFDKKKKTEDDFQLWISKENELSKKYGQAITNVNEAYQLYDKIIISQAYFGEAILGCEILSFANRFVPLQKLLLDPKTDDATKKKTIDMLRASSEAFFKDYNKSTDKKVTAALLEMYAKAVPREQQAGTFQIIESKFKGDFSKFTDELFENSIFSDKSKVDKLLNEPNIKVFKKDMAFLFAVENVSKYEKEIRPVIISLNEKLEKGNRLFVDGTRKMLSDKKFYPNANSTMRFTYGRVGDYIPRDAVKYDYFSTIEGVMQKEDPKNDEFIVPSKLKELYNKKDYGPYADKNGNLTVCFLSNNDITGGNSGSPVINGEGHLIGCAFDGNWEAMSGDVAFEPNLQRTISVDIRYVLFIIDKYAGASNLIKEMKIISNN